MILVSLLLFGYRVLLLLQCSIAIVGLLLLILLVFSFNILAIGFSIMVCYIVQVCSMLYVFMCSSMLLAGSTVHSCVYPPAISLCIHKLVQSCCSFVHPYYLPAHELVPWFCSFMYLCNPIAHVFILAVTHVFIQLLVWSSMNYCDSILFHDMASMFTIVLLFLLVFPLYITARCLSVDLNTQSMRKFSWTQKGIRDQW